MALNVAMAYEAVDLSAEDPLTSKSRDYDKSVGTHFEQETGGASSHWLASSLKPDRRGREPVRAQIPPSLLEPTFLDEEHRARQRTGCCGWTFDAPWIPVIVDLCWGRVRSRISVALVLLQVANFLLLQTYLPKFGLPAIPFCTLSAYYAGNNDPPINIPVDIDRFESMAVTFTQSYMAYMPLALIGLQEWNGAVWLLVATVVAWVNAGLTASLEVPACAALAKVNPPQLIIIPDNDDYSGNSTRVIAIYYLLSWSCTMLVAIDLTRLAAQAALKWHHTGERPAFLVGEVDPWDPARKADGSHGCSHSAGAGGASQSASEAGYVSTAFARASQLASCIPLRHLAACLLSSLSLLYFALFFSGFFDLCGTFVDAVWSIYKSVDPNNPPEDIGESRSARVAQRPAPACH